MPSSARRDTCASAGDVSGEFGERDDPFEELSQRWRRVEPGGGRDSLSSCSSSYLTCSVYEEDEAVGLENRPRTQRSGSSQTLQDEGGEQQRTEQQVGQLGGPLKDRGGEEQDGNGRDSTQEQELDHTPKEGGEGGVGGELSQDTKGWQRELGQAGDLPVRNGWGTIRYALREPFAEFLGTLALVIIGVGSDCQTKLSQNTAGTIQSMHWSWGFATMTAIYLAGGVSGGHNNPAITITLALFRGFPWKMVPRYIVAQIFGAFCGALIIYANYRLAIKQYDPYKLIKATEYSSNVSATLFITAPATQVGGTVRGFCQELLASAILSMAVLALGDENNAPPGAGLGAIVLAFVVVAIGMSNGWISGYAINVARDLGPRLALWCVGYGIDLWHHDDWWWLSGAICGPVVGGIAGALAYDLCIFTGPGSPVNYTLAEMGDVIGYRKASNLARMAFSPSYRRRRLTARTQSPDDILDAGLAPAALAQGRSATSSVPPGRASQDEANEMALSGRFRRARDKVEEEERVTRERMRKEEGGWRRSSEEHRYSEGGTQAPKVEEA
ncbi:hypothetical protein JCM10213v2_001058 [Rhodosporidiobolus nylandii]